MNLKKLTDRGLDLLYPPSLYCSCCGNLIDESRTYNLCDHCMSHIRWDGGEPEERDGMKSIFCTRYGIYERSLIFALILLRLCLIGCPWKMLLSTQLYRCRCIRKRKSEEVSITRP